MDAVAFISTAGMVPRYAGRGLHIYSFVSAGVSCAFECPSSRRTLCRLVISQYVRKGSLDKLSTLHEDDIPEPIEI